MRILGLSFAVMSGVFLLTEQAGAQTGQRFSVQGSVLFASLFGEAYESVGNGAGFEIQARYTPSAFSVGAGFQYTNHGSEDPSIDGDFSLLGGFVEPRYVFPTQSDNLGPYVSTRFSILRERASVQGFSGSATGLNANVGGGMLLRVGPRVNLDFGATFGYTNFDEIVFRDPDGDIIGREEGGPGSNLVLRLGVAVGLGE